jgi:hypothetical protein
MAEGQSNAEEYKDIEKKTNSYKTAIKIYNQSDKILENINKGSYDKEVDAFENKVKSKIDSYKEDLQEKKKQFKTQGKNQLNSLVDLLETSVLGSGNTDTKTFIRNVFIETTNRSKDRVKQILSQEIISSIGCSQEQNYNPITVYIKVPSIDIFGETLKQSPNETPGKYLYENYPFNPNRLPYAFNKELYNRIQKNGITYKQEYSTSYLGITGQELFNITYTNLSGTTFSADGYYKVDLLPRATSTKVVDFVGDYLDTIDILNIKEVYQNVLNLLTGVISNPLKYGDDSLRDQTKFEKFIQRILGICFDNKTEIDVSGVGKLDQLDQVDDSIFELDEIDNLEIENKIKNILSGVVEYIDCGNIKLPVNSQQLLPILDGFDQENLTPTDYDFLAKNMLVTLSNNPKWKIQVPELKDWEDIINKQVLELIPIAVVNSLMSPKHLFPLFVMSKALGQTITDDIETLEDFARVYRKYLLNLVSKIVSIYVEELVKVITKELKKLIQDYINQELNQLILKRNKTVQTILLLIQAGLETAALISDYRRCKSVLDELQRLLQTGLRIARLNGAQIPPIVNYFAYLKPGMSPISLLRRTIEKMDELGVPTGDLPSGKPNLGLIIQQAYNQTLMDEIAENAKVSVSISSAEVYGLMTGTAPTPIINLSGNLE